MDEFNAPDLSIVVPCYNEQNCLHELRSRIDRVAARLHKSYELILVNDGSRDKTWEVIRSLCEADSRVVGVDLSRNFGQEACMLAGLKLSTGEFTLIIDADLQDPPELLGAMLSVMEKGADVVYGKRAKREGETPFKLYTAWAFYRLMEWLADVPIPRNTGSFRLIRRNAVEAINAMPEQAKYFRGLVSWVGFRQEPLLYERHARFAGTSSWPTLKMLRLAINAIVAFSFKPLRLSYLATFCLALLSLVIGAYSLCVFILKGDAIVVATGLILFALASTASIQTLILGIISEYIGQAVMESRNRPKYLISETLNRFESQCHV